MLRYTIRRLLQLVVALFALSLLLFIWLRSLPGGTVTALLGDRATPEKVAALRTALGLDQPIIVQYFKYLGRMLRGDFGTSTGVAPGTPALEVFGARFGATVELAIGAMVFALIFGIPLGYLAARRKGGWMDNAGILASLVGIAIPVFFLAFLMKWLFAVKLGWLPPSGRQSPDIDATRVTGFFILDGLITREWDASWDSIRHLILPWIALGTIPFAVIFRITRSSVLEVQNEDFVRTAQAKGLTTRVIRGRHILRNAMLPVVTIVGLQVGGLLAGAVLTETIFNLAGVGRAVTEAIATRDYSVVQGFVLVIAIGYLFLNLLVDISYAFLDPRVRLS